MRRRARCVCVPRAAAACVPHVDGARWILNSMSHEFHKICITTTTTTTTACYVCSVHLFINAFVSFARFSFFSICLFFEKKKNCIFSPKQLRAQFFPYFLTAEQIRRLYYIVRLRRKRTYMCRRTMLSKLERRREERDRGEREGKKRIENAKYTAPAPLTAASLTHLMMKQIIKRTEKP